MACNRRFARLKRALSLSMNLDAALADELIDKAIQLVGHRISDFRFHVLRDEAVPEDIADPSFYFGGEIEVLLGDRGYFVSWAENIGWSDGTHFSLYIGDTTAFVPNSLTSIPASRHPDLTPHIGERIVGVKLHGFNSAPHVLELTTESGLLMLGCGGKRAFGEGDDVRVSQDPSHLTRMNRVWECTG